MAKLTFFVMQLYCCNVSNKLEGKPNVDIFAKLIALPLVIKSRPNTVVAKLIPVISALIKSFILLYVPSKKS